MSVQHSDVVDLVSVTSPAKLPSVAQRIERRIELLTQWLRNGIPPGKTVPPSLNKAREWHDETLGILPIGSATDFASTNKIHGQRIKDFDKLRREVLERYAPPPGTKKSGNRRRSRPPSAKKVDRTISALHITAAVSQWHSERDQRLAEQARAVSAEARSVQLLKENAEKDVLVADLRRQLASHIGLKAVR
jgi:hypothetical protein